MSVMTEDVEVTEGHRAFWWRIVAEHEPDPATGVCPKCDRRRCWPRADALGDLKYHDLLRLGPPIDDRPHPSAG